MSNSTIVKVNGELIDYDYNTHTTFKDIQNIVGGKIDYISNDKHIVFINDEGLLLQLPPNIKVSHLMRMGVTIVGDCLVILKEEYDRVQRLIKETNEVKN